MSKMNEKILDSELLYLNDFFDKEIGGEIKLWRAVIEKALEDLSLPRSNKRYCLWQKRASEWFDLGNPEFMIVCQYAMVRPQSILKIANKISNKK